MNNKLILDSYLVGHELIYGLKTKEANTPSRERAASVLLPTHAPHTRYFFAIQKQTEIIKEFAKRLASGFTVGGTYGVKAIGKINQCSRIADYYTTNKGAWKLQLKQ